MTRINPPSATAATVVRPPIGQYTKQGKQLGAALDLVELAVTWSELDYSQEYVIAPQDWLDFAAEHRWEDGETAERLFSAAVDIAHRATGFDEPRC